MKIIGLAKPDAGGNQNLICTLKEVEVDKITGVAGKPHTPHRYKAGTDINLGKIYNRVKAINENIDEIRAAMIATKGNADEIDAAIPIIKEP